MTEGRATEEHDAYLSERVRRELARDRRVADLALEVEEAGGRLRVSGSVPTAERRDAAGEVVAEVAECREVVNDVVVEPFDALGEPEHLT